MLKEIPYEALKQNERDYEILQLRDQQQKTLGEIAGAFKISVTRVTQIYYRIKYRQIRLYLDHLSIVLGEGPSQIAKIYKEADECYQSALYACAYLEKKYKDILTEYRNGEPGMPQQFLKSMPPFKPELSKETVARIIEMKERENASFAQIAKELGITRQKAKDTYDRYYHAKNLELIKTLQESAESEQEKMALWEEYFRNNYSSKKRYEMLAKK